MRLKVHASVTQSDFGKYCLTYPSGVIFDVTIPKYLLVLSRWKNCQDLPSFEEEKWRSPSHLPLCFLGEKYCKTYPLWFWAKNTARLTPCDFDEITARLTPCDFEKMARLTPCDFDEKLARLTPYDFGWKILQDLPLMILGEKYCKTYPLWFWWKNGKTYPLWFCMKNGKTLFDIDRKIARLSSCDFDEKWQDLPFVIFDEKMARLTPCDFVWNNGKTLFDIDRKIARLSSCDLMKNGKTYPLWFLMKKWQDLPLMILREKYCKTYPLWFWVKNTARLTPCDFLWKTAKHLLMLIDKLQELALVILMKNCKTYPLVILMKKLQDLPLVILGEKYCKTYPLWFWWDGGGVTIPRSLLVLSRSHCPYHPLGEKHDGPQAIAAANSCHVPVSGAGFELERSNSGMSAIEQTSG